MKNSNFHFLLIALLICTSANAQTPAFIESCESEIRVDSEENTTAGEQCKVIFSDGTVEKREHACEMHGGCPQALGYCAYIPWYTYKFGSVGQAITATQTETSEQDSFDQKLLELQEIYTKESLECKEGEVNGRVFCQINFDGDRVIEIDENDPQLKYIEGVSCSKVPGCKGFIDYCTNSIETLQNKCESNPAGTICEDFDLEWVGEDGFINFLLKDFFTETSSANCVDEDGDGWGWIQSSQSSCQVPNFTPVAGECVDPDGDGWGWNGLETCDPT